MADGNLNAIRYRWWKEGQRDLSATALLGVQHYARSIGDTAVVEDIEAWFAEYGEAAQT